jgi:hypothetical protein
LARVVVDVYTFSVGGVGWVARGGGDGVGSWHYFGVVSVGGEVPDGVEDSKVVDWGGFVVLYCKCDFCLGVEIVGLIGSVEGELGPHVYSVWGDYGGDCPSEGAGMFTTRESHSDCGAVIADARESHGGIFVFTGFDKGGYSFEGGYFVSVV